ncbi:hypothetical protein ACWN8V_05260 [Vagococcus elongatus]|uniref:LemA family protein n=1 Tax=Vagococcus elongatus TaxID=180344 RepID=A0A430ANS6_9ENTE|nr:hypothetical protein [Vagococcus elongatus]RSU09564.1 hypothetical protein CBF29_11200 [Vagococcus elongatus]
MKTTMKKIITVVKYFLLYLFSFSIISVIIEIFEQKYSPNYSDVEISDLNFLVSLLLAFGVCITLSIIKKVKRLRILEAKMNQTVQSWSYYLSEREQLFTTLTEAYNETFQKKEKTIGFMRDEVNTVIVEKIESYEDIDKLLETYPRTERIIQLLEKVQENSENLQQTRKSYQETSSNYTILTKSFITRKFSNPKVANEFSSLMG